ncbi:MAG: hypothetical protein ABSG30_09150 [Steroidobacteraceae bacterium]|jgi:hypothetical protein
MRLLLSIPALALLLLGATGASRAETDPCNGYKWDVSTERALFATPAKAAAAGKDLASATPAVPNQLYAVTLLPVSGVSFPAAPGRTPPSGSFAGILALTLPAGGKYRIAVDVPLWIDVVGGATVAPVLDYEGLHECSAPRKVVVFDLQGRTDWALQLSAADRVTVRLAVTPVR